MNPLLLSAEFLQQLEILALRIQKTRNLHLAGEQQSEHLGSGLEFHDFAPYQPGDDYRYVDWNLYSRLGQLFLKKFIEEHDMNIHILLDASTSMAHFPDKFRLAAEIAAAIGFLALRQLDKVGAAYVTDTVTRELRPRKGRTQIFRLFDFLNEPPAMGATDLARVLLQLGYRYKHPGYAVVLSDFFDQNDIEPAVTNLLRRGWQVLLVHILSSEEIDPHLDGSVVLVDAESGHRVVIEADTIRDRYQERLQQFRDKLASMVSFGAHYVPVSTQDAVTEVIFKAFRAKGVVR